jgi:hypothetical protein
VAPAQPAPIASRTASPEASESGQITVLGESRDLDAPPSTSTPAPAGGSSALESGGALLAIGADGTILRAARGACPASAAAPLAVSRDFGTTWTPVSARVTQVLGVGASGAGAMWFVGTDTSCRPAAQESVDGLTWRQRGVAGTWYLNPDRDSTDVASPRLLADVGCVPAALAGIDARRAVAACVGGDIRVTDDSGDSWTTRARMAATAALAFVSADRGYALGGTDGCPAVVLLTVDGARTWTPLACLGDAVPLAIAAASARATTSATSATSATPSGADMVVAQAGTELYVSRDGGRSWRTTAGG